MRVRALRPDDRESLLALWNRSAPLDSLTPELLHEKVWGDPAFDADLAIVADEAGELVGFGMGVLWPTPDVLRGSIKLLGVAPEHRRQGLGGGLVEPVQCITQGHPRTWNPLENHRVQLLELTA